MPGAIGAGSGLVRTNNVLSTPVAEFLASLSLQAHGLASLNTQVEIQLLDDASRWTLVIEKGEVRVQPGECEGPSVIVKTHAVDGQRLLEGSLGYEEAIVAGRLRVSGDVGLAAQLAESLKRS